MSGTVIKQLRRGHQTCYTSQLANEICERISLGETLAGICRDRHMPPRTSILEWVRTNRDGFADRYACARDRQLEHWADELVDISDDARNDWMERNGEVQFNNENVQRSRLRIDTRKWLLCKLKPDKYGARILSEQEGNLTVRIVRGLGEKE